MDPVTLAATAVAALNPYLLKAAEKIAGNAGDAAWKAGSALFDSLKKRFAGQPAAAAALDDLAAAPLEADNQAALRKEIRKLLASDPGFARELSGLVEGVAKAGGISFVNHVAGSVGSITQIGTAGDVHIGGKP